MRIKIEKNIWIKFLSLFLAISIVLRCSPNLIYRKTIIEYLIILGLTALSIINFKVIKPYFFEIFILIIPLLYLSSKGITKFIIFSLVSIFYYFCIQKNYNAIYIIRYPIIVFGIFTSCITWLSFLFPLFYTSKVLPVLPASNELTYSFIQKKMYMGFTTHYSRNAFYIILAILFLFAEVICKKKRNEKIRYVLLLFLIATEMLVAKRGPVLFLILTIMTLILIKEPSLSKKIKKFGRYIAIILMIIFLIVVIIPGADNIIIRIVSSAETGDITTGRIKLYVIGFNMFKNNPFLGQGWGSFLELMTGTSFQGVHNDYIQLLAETGIIGFVIILIGNLGALKYSIKAYKIFKISEFDNSQEQLWLTFSIGYQIFFMLYALTGLPHFSYEQNTIYFMLCGFGVGMYRLQINMKERKNK